MTLEQRLNAVFVQFGQDMKALQARVAHLESLGGVIVTPPDDPQPSTDPILTVVINGLDDTYEVQVAGVAWTNNQKSFPAGTILDAITPTVAGYDLSPLSMDGIVMDVSKTITFTATAHMTTPAGGGGSTGAATGQAIKLNFDGGEDNVPGWNDIYRGVDEDIHLIDSNGSGTYLKASDVDNDHDTDGPLSVSQDYLQYPMQVVNTDWNRAGGIIAKFNGFNTLSSYEVRVLCGVAFANPDQTINVNDGATQTCNPGSGPVELVFPNIVPNSSGEIIISVQGQGYPTISAAIITEY